jgi:hypothetical protein
MTLVSANTIIPWPGVANRIGGVPAVAQESTLNASGDYLARIISAPQDMVITHIGWRNVGATASPQAIVSVEGVDTSGFPDGANAGGSTQSAATTVTANVYNAVALQASATITKGSLIALKVLYSSGTSFVPGRITGPDTGNFNLPYLVDNSTGTPSKGSQVGWSTICPHSAAGVTYPIRFAFPLNVIHATSGVFDNTSSAQRGMRFQLPFGARAVGLQWYNGVNTADYTVQLMDDSENILSSSDTAFEGAASVESNGAVHVVYFDNTVTLTASTWYKATVVPAAASAAVYALQAPNATYAPGFRGGGNSLYTYYN